MTAQIKKSGQILTWELVGTKSIQSINTRDFWRLQPETKMVWMAEKMPDCFLNEPFQTLRSPKAKVKTWENCSLLIGKNNENYPIISMLPTAKWRALSDWPISTCWFCGSFVGFLSTRDVFPVTQPKTASGIYSNWMSAATRRPSALF